MTDINTQIAQLIEQLKTLTQAVLAQSYLQSNNSNYTHPYIGQYVLARCYGPGVHCGILKSFDPTTGIAFLTETRRLWEWDKAFSLTEVSLYGIGGSSKLPETTQEIMVTNVLELVPTTPQAAESIKNWKIHSNR